MKSTIKILIALSIIASIVSPTKAHEGMIALYADSSPTSCQAILPELTFIGLSLFYIRGDGPHLGPCIEFRLLKSNDDVQLNGPIWAEEHGLVGTMGTLESGITISYQMDTDGHWCFEDADYAFLGTIQVVNISDPDTFTVSVVEHPLDGDPGINIVDCNYPLFTIYKLIGGTFVFNGTCASPENPFQSPTSVQSSTWGAIKGLFRQ